MSKKIAAAAFLLSIAGLSAELLSLFKFSGDSHSSILVMRGFLSSLNLGFFGVGLIEYHNSDMVFSLNYLNVIFYATLFIGASVYTLSNGKETRLIRFVISIVFICNVVYFIMTSATPILYRAYIKSDSYAWWVTWFFGLLKDAILVYASFSILNVLRQTKMLSTELIEGEANSIPIYIGASRWKRFTHQVVDTFICLFVLSPFTRVFGEHFLRNIGELAGERAAIFVFLLIARLIYYPFFEIVLSATPAKLLTESRVIDEDGQMARPLTIIKRTLARFIPFEPLSFFSERGWHDTISRTQVVNEVRTGVSGYRYLLIIPFFLILSLGIYLGHEQYKNYKSYLYAKERHEQKISDIQRQLKNLTTSHIIEIEDVDNMGSSYEIFLKIEEINSDEVTAFFLQRAEEYSNLLKTLEKQYNYNIKIGSLLTVKFKRSDLDHAYTFDYDQSRSNKRNAFPLLEDGRRFQIKNIDILFGPSIHDRGTGSYGENISIDLMNYGWPAHVVSIETIEGTIRWDDDLPKEAPTVKHGDYPNFTVHGSAYKRGQKYKFKMEVLDSLNHSQTYIIEGRDLEKTVQRVE